MSDDINHKHFDQAKLTADIEKFGWTVMLLEATGYLPSFAYTVGLWKNYNHPEIISFGLTTSTLHLILNDAGEMVKSGQVIETGKTYDRFFENGITQFLKVDPRNIADYFGQAINFYNTNAIPALQLVWTDRKNKFPWEQEFEKEFEFRQPLLDRNAEFKFREPENLAVFTTRQWLELDQPILQVIHDNEGDWQFLTGDETQEDARVMALGHLIKKDPTLNEVFDLELGEAAERKYVGDAWTRKEADIIDGE